MEKAAFLEEKVFTDLKKIAHEDTQEDIQVETTTDLDFILLEIVGAIDLEQVGALTQLIDVPGGEYLDALKN